MENETDMETHEEILNAVCSALTEIGHEYSNVKLNTFFTRLCVEDDMTRALMGLEDDVGFNIVGIICDSSNNPDDGDNLRVDVLICPKRSTEIIELIILVKMKGIFEDKFAAAMKGV